MKKYAIIDQIKNGDGFEKFFDTADAAVSYAEFEWNRMTTHDQNRRESFYVVECELDEDGCIDYNTANVIKTIK